VQSIFPKLCEVSPLRTHALQNHQRCRLRHRRQPHRR
jgi:hypothetical protein